VPSRYAEAVPGPGSHLERYARRLNAVEINSSFHRPHQHKTYERWAQSTPVDFRFSVKVPKAITHERALVDCASLVETFAGEIAGLGDKLAVLLVQLPRTSKADRATTGRFFDQLRAVSDAAIAFEPRHADWFAPEAGAWLADRRIARVAADPAPAPDASEPGSWGGIRYYRWHGSPRLYYSDYDEAALAALRKRSEADVARAPVWCIFDNTASGAALGNALTLAGL
jgi:uncharacterized protein YecE (DUF72 family)